MRARQQCEMHKMPRREFFVLLIAAAFAVAGCGGKHVVRAGPPSVSTPAPPPKRPAPRSRPAQPDPAPPKPAPPQISPQLSAQDLATAKNNTTSNIKTAEENVQLANGKQLSAAQKDLVEKISGFLGQAHEAIRADDWVRAQ